MQELRSPPAGTSRGTITLLFTDVEGSTRLLQRFGDLSVRMLEDHKTILRQTVGEFGGREVDTAGDGFFIVFDVARDAVAAAVECQRRLAAHPWPEGEPVRVRMGLHTGEPIIAGTKYLGLDVHRAARICAAGHGGQILISSTTRQLVINELPGGIGLRDLGEHRLKDLQHPETVFQVVGAGLRLEFPPLRAFGPHHTNLPVQATRLIGRESELMQLRRLLLEDRVRLLTLTGPGGTGKTRLALQVATDLLRGYEDGIVLVQLAATPEASLVPSAVAHTLGITAGADQTSLDAVLEYLRPRKLLLVLDNFEHVIGAAGDVARVLGAAPRLQALVTSRIPLNLTLEQEFPVAPLLVPDPRRERSSDRLMRYPALELFAQRAAAVSPSFAVDDESAPIVAEICYRLDGLPLAIELAAARVKVFPPRALLARLDKRLELLSGGARDMPARHRTLRQAIAWSHDLLDAAEQALFRRLAAFAGGASFDAIEAVCEAAGPLDAPLVDLVSALVDKSLLRQEALRDGEPRFTMLETIREFAQERLVASGEEDATRAAHAEFFIMMAEQAEPELTGPMQMMWLEKLEREHDNIRAVLHWAVRTGDAARGLRLGGAFWRYWVVRGHMTEGRERLGAVLAIPAHDTRPMLRVKALLGAATMAHEQSDIAVSRALLEETLRIVRDAGDRHLIGRTLTNLGWAEFHGGNHERARQLSNEGLAIHRELKDTRGIALALNNLGWICNFEGDCAQARRLHTESLTLRRQLGDARGIAFAQANLAWPTHRLGMSEEAERYLTDAVETLRALGDQQLLGYALVVRGQVYCDLGRWEDAIAPLTEALELGQAIGQRWDTVGALVRIADARLGMGDRQNANAAIEQLRASRYEHEVPWDTGQIARVQGDWLRACGRLQEAVAEYRTALHEFGRLSARYELSRCLLGLAMVLSETGDAAPAARLVGAVGSMREQMGTPVTPAEHEPLEALERSLRRALGDEACEAEVRAGGVLSWQEAVGHALAVTGPRQAA
jgi:predicted ATPase/class 3 adenylate cyclase